MVPQGNHLGERRGGVERKTNLTLPTYVWVGGNKPLAKWPKVPEGESMTALIYLFCMAEPLHTKSYFLLRLCFVLDYTNDYTGWEV